MPANLTETTCGGSVSVASAEHSNLERPTIADDMLRLRIINFLCARGVQQAEALEVEVRGGAVSIRGRLSDRHAKWLCLECCRHVAGVIKLIDNVELEASIQEDAAEDTEEQINDDVTGALPRKLR